MRKGAIGVGHAVGIFALLDRLAAAIERVKQFAAEAFAHGVLTALAGRFDQPANGKRLLALGANFDRHLVGGTTDAAGANLNRGADIFERGVKDLNGVLLGTVLDEIEGTINDAFGGGLLAVVHQGIHEF